MTIVIYTNSNYYTESFVRIVLLKKWLIVCLNAIGPLLLSWLSTEGTMDELSANIILFEDRGDEKRISHLHYLVRRPKGRRTNFSINILLNSFLVEFCTSTSPWFHTFLGRINIFLKSWRYNISIQPRNKWFTAHRCTYIYHVIWSFRVTLNKNYFRPLLSTLLLGQSIDWILKYPCNNNHTWLCDWYQVTIKLS